VAKKQPDNREPQDKVATAAAREERRRIFRELHDQVLQLLSSVRLRAEVCRRELIGNPQALEKELCTIEENTEVAVAEIRRLLSETQTESDLIAGTLERRLREELEIFRSRSGLRLNFQCNIGNHRLPYDVERELYFTLRESIINVIRHSRASELKLSLFQNDTTCTATVEDNGSGFNMASIAGGSHYGLRIMRERIEKLGGQFSIDTAPGKGTRIAMTIPIQAQPT
jgi:signal transduction histidine kinase